MSALTTAQKDANALIPDIKAAYEAHLRSGNEMMSLAIEIGKGLLQMKKLLPHGEFQVLVEERFDFSYRSAANYMRIAEGIERLPSGVEPEDMSIRGLLKLVNESKSATAALISPSRGSAVEAPSPGADAPSVEAAEPPQESAAAARQSPPPAASESGDSNPAAMATDGESGAALAKQFKDLLEFIRRAVKLTDLINTATGRKHAAHHECTLTGLDSVGKEVQKWRRACQ
jgi:hypothetical protein